MKLRHLDVALAFFHGRYAKNGRLVALGDALMMDGRQCLATIMPDGLVVVAQGKGRSGSIARGAVWKAASQVERYAFVVVDPMPKTADELRAAWLTHVEQRRELGLAPLIFTGHGVITPTIGKVIDLMAALKASLATPPGGAR